MNGHRAYLDLRPDYRSKSHSLPAKGHRTYINPAPFRRARIVEESREQANHN